MFPVQVGLNESGGQGVPTSIYGHKLNGSIKKNEDNNRKITNTIYLVLFIIIVLLINSNQIQIEFDLM